jgi:hypothetical protein
MTEEKLDQRIKELEGELGIVRRKFSDWRFKMREQDINSAG